MNESKFLKILEERKKRLEAEGVFAKDKKKAIPKNPEHIGIICDPYGTAIRDIHRLMQSNNKSESIFLLPINKMDIAGSIVNHIKSANNNSIYDVLLITHGGGTLEELLPWSDEKVVRAIAESKIPVISAVGHEIDWTFCDYVADLRAPTPSASIEILFPDAKDKKKGKKKESSEDYYVVVKMPNGMYFPFYDKFAPFDRMRRIVEGKEVNNLQSITPLVITHCSNDWIPFAVKEGGVVKKIKFKFENL